MFKPLKALLAATLVATALPASAVLQIAGDFGGSLFFCVDQNVTCDTNPAVGLITLAPLTLNGVEIIGSSQIQTIGALNSLNTSSFQVINHNLFDIDIALAVSGIDFLGPVTSFTASGSGTWQSADGSIINLLYYGDAANTQGADTAFDLPGLQLASFADVAVGAADAFSFNATGAFSAPGPFHSLSLGTTGTLEAWDGLAGTESVLVGRSQTILTQQQVVPEPGTMVLLGAALVGLGWMQRRRAV